MSTDKERKIINDLDPAIGKKSVLDTSLQEPVLGAALEMAFSLGKQQGLLKKDKDVEMIPIEVTNKLSESHYLNSNVPAAYSYHVVGRNNREDSTDDLKEGIYQINGAFNNDSFPKVSQVFLVIVFKGEMYSINEDKHLNPVKHVIFFNINSPSINDVSCPPRLIYIVRDSYFEEYLDILKQDLEILASLKQTSSS